MSKTKRLLTPLESIQMAWGLKLRDFRQWCQPTTQALFDWKSRRLEGAIVVARTSMMDDVEAMLKSLQENQNDKASGDTSESGTSVYLPVMMTAISAIETPPDFDQLIPQPQWMPGVVPSDPLQRVIEFRTTPAAYRCQIAFFAPDPHSVSAISNQFVNFFKFEAKRQFDVFYEIGFAGEHIIRDAWNFRVVENSLYPDKADAGLKNMHIITVDCNITGLEPIVVGLGAEWDNVTDTGEPESSLPSNAGSGSGNTTGGGKPLPGFKPLPGHRTPSDVLGKYVIEADIKDTDLQGETRVSIDPDTHIITQTQVGDDTP
ncbi:hypothetical protein [Psychrobacter sp. I-STPA10]|uniref:hypothetical protein n=1 Tax=Psychrobacter sp. I-STPA10 TaxID=2585769 RepID=UPI001E63BD3C|nr:hypothetical protein [Psychrobacter sp. I-STPA10]